MMQESLKPFTENGRNNFDAIDWGHKGLKKAKTARRAENFDKSIVSGMAKNSQPQLTH